ncbi:MAG: hypothetical protein WD595_04770 [Waddliaceae bacterium]
MAADVSNNNSFLTDFGGEIFRTGLYTGATALAAVAISSPIGPAVGAVAGGVGYLAGRAVEYVCVKAFNMNSKLAIVVSTITSIVAGFFATAGATLGVSSAFGYSMTFGAACALTGVSFGIGLGVLFGVALIAAIAKTCLQPSQA